MTKSRFVDLLIAFGPALTVSSMHPVMVLVLAAFSVSRQVVWLDSWQ